MKHDKFFTPFNGYKSLIHVPEWRRMVQTGVIPYPIQIGIDMANSCNLSCTFCNSKELIDKNVLMSKETIDKVAHLMSIGFSRAVCVGGGGESLCNPLFNYLVDTIHMNTKVGIVTNGVNAGEFVGALKKCKWVGISLDSATRSTFKKIKNADLFDRVVGSIRKLVLNDVKDLTVKFLIWPGNEHEIFEACKLAKNLGTRRFQVRPADFPWFIIKQNKRHLFTKASIDIINEQLNMCEELESSDFEVIITRQNFTDDYKRNLDFKNCYAGLFNCIIHPDGKISLCLDRRSDSRTYLCNIDEVKKVWGSQKHKDIVKSIDISNCPRCSFRTHNIVFENEVLDDKMYCEHL